MWMWGLHIGGEVAREGSVKVEVLETRTRTNGWTDSGKRDEELLGDLGRKAYRGRTSNCVDKSMCISFTAVVLDDRVSIHGPRSTRSFPFVSHVNRVHRLSA